VNTEKDFYAIAAARLALCRLPGLADAALREILTRFTDPRCLFAPGRLPDTIRGLPSEIRRCLTNAKGVISSEDHHWLRQADHRLIAHTDSVFPPALIEVTAPPPLLFVRGQSDSLLRPQLAIVGSRNPTPVGMEVAHQLARELATRGIVVVSGLAAGIDTAAHRGALSAEGTTVAVLGCGTDRPYPSENRRLAALISKTGAVISEFPPGTPPRREHFPRRNRIISGLSLGVVVVEAARRSGALITARLAGEQGREVFAVPGSIRNPMTRGCHTLIRDGAKLVEGVDDILEELPLLNELPSLGDPVGGEHVSSRTPLNTAQKDLLMSIGYDSVSVDLLVQRTQLTAEQVSSMLLILELEGYIAAAPDGTYTQLGDTRD